MGNSTDHFPISVMFTAKDMKKSLAFYRDTLGFQLEQCWPDEKNPMWANMMLDKQSVMLGASMSAEATNEMCAGADEATKKDMKAMSDDFQKHKPGVGVITYLQVPDVDKHHAKLVKNGVKGLAEPKNQFYGIRDFAVLDPDGYRLLFYTTIKMSSCQSCGMPLKDSKPGDMYCQYCTDDQGKLRPYEAVLEGTTSGYFMAMQKMPRKEAVEAARKHLATMPAWHGRN